MEMGFKFPQADKIRNVKVESGYDDVKVEAAIFKTDKGIKMLEFVITDSRYPEPKEYNIQFAINRARDRESEDWFADVIGREFAILIKRSASDMRSWIKENYQSFIRSLGV